jgi:two-component system NtrC family sensor kinase
MTLLFFFRFHAEEKNFSPDAKMNILPARGVRVEDPRSGQLGPFAEVTMKLGLKFLIALLLVMFVGFAAFTYINVKSEASDLLEQVELAGLRTTDLIKESIHYSMLINRKEDIHQIFKNFSEMPGFEVIRIYDKNGEVIFTTRAGEASTKVPISSEACQVCHRYPEPLKALATKQRHRIITSPRGYRVLALINPIENEPACYGSGCHLSPDRKFILGVLDVQMSLATVDADIGRSRRQTVWASVILVLSVLFVTALLVWTLIRAPVRRLTAGTRAIARGDLDYTIPLKRKDEIGELANSFNTMTTQLKKAREELGQIQSHLIQVEKMVSLGKLCATVAHELNNPLGGILTYARLSQRKLSAEGLTQERIASIREDLSIVADESSRCGNIVKNLLLFSKRQIGEFAVMDLHEILDRSTLLVEHHLKLNNVELIKLYQGNGAEILCDREQIQQAFLAILDNAVEAMPHGGTLTIVTNVNLRKKRVQIQIQDTGSGISPADLPHVFEPFYTTKREGKGVGLGLSVCYGIIERHDGTIEATSVVGEGTNFIIQLPLHSIRNGGDVRSEDDPRTSTKGSNDRRPE